MGHRNLHHKSHFNSVHIFTTIVSKSVVRGPIYTGQHIELIVRITTPRERELLEKLIVTQLINEFFTL
jgi:hypothetical protein